MKICSICGIKLVKPFYICAACKKLLCGRHSFSYVDGNNESITRNSPTLCKECYGLKYQGNK